MSQRKKKKSSGGASGASSRKRSDPKKAAEVKKSKQIERFKALGIAVAFWGIVLTVWSVYSGHQKEQRQEDYRAFKTQAILKQIDNALAAYAADNGGGVPQSSNPEEGGSILFRRLAMPKAGASSEPTDDPEVYLRLWAGQISRPDESGEATIVDEWDRPIQYIAPGENGERYRLWSVGSDAASQEEQWIFSESSK